MSRKVTHDNGRLFGQSRFVRDFQSRIRWPSSTVIVVLAGYWEAIRRGVAALVDVLQLAGAAANAMPPAEVATS